MRKLSGISKCFTEIFAIALTAFHILTGIFGLLPSHEQRSIHLGLGLALIFALNPIREKGKEGHNTFTIPWYDIFIIIIILISTGNIFLSWKKYMPFMLFPPTLIENFLAVSLIIICIEAGRRVVGGVFPLLTGLVLIYAIWGHLIPGTFGHPQFTLQKIINQLYFSAEGIWGFLTGISATYIAMFMIFGVLLLNTMGGETFINLALSLAGKYKGGPAKVAVISSGFFGMISGSAMANAATTGNFTIPLMKKLGYKPEFAAAVEATASTGGTVTPPIMGAAAFIIAEYMGCAYKDVAKAAIIPSLLFYTAVFFAVHFHSLKSNLLPVPKENIPSIKSYLKFEQSVALFGPITILVYTIIKGYSLITIATSAVLSAVLFYIITGIFTRNLVHRIKQIPIIFKDAGDSIITIIPILVCANIIVQLLNFTGLSVKFSNLIISFGQKNLFLGLLFTGILVMLLGTGLPATAAYILGYVVAGPMLIKWGILPMAAHLFILYYSILATITPPVCPTVFLTASMAKANWVTTGIMSVKLAPVLYIIPFIFVKDPTLIMIGPITSVIINVVTAIIGTIAISSSMMGYLLNKCNIVERILLAGAGLLLIIPGIRSDILAIVIIIGILYKQIINNRNRADIE